MSCCFLPLRLPSENFCAPNSQLCSGRNRLQHIPDRTGSTKDQRIQQGLEMSASHQSHAKPSHALRSRSKRKNRRSRMVLAILKNATPASAPSQRRSRVKCLVADDTIRQVLIKFTHVFQMCFRCLSDVLHPKAPVSCWYSRRVHICRPQSSPEHTATLAICSSVP